MLWLSPGIQVQRPPGKVEGRDHVTVQPETCGGGSPGVAPPWDSKPTSWHCQVALASDTLCRVPGKMAAVTTVGTGINAQWETLSHGGGGEGRGASSRGGNSGWLG